MHAIRLLIDGYNLLHATGIVGTGSGSRSLRRARGALLNFLAEAIDPELIGQTVVVFDAKDPPPGSVPHSEYRGMLVHFSAQFEDADAQIEELIRTHSAPRRLTVVSSDHRIHKAAKRRRATVVDSDVWYDEISKQRAGRPRPDKPASPEEAKPTAPLNENEVHRWLEEFGPFELKQSGEKSDKPAKVENVESEDVYNPFPPGYAEDLLDERDL